MTDTDVLRRFNRTYTQRIGALDESFLGLGLPLGAARLVFEIGEAGATVRDLRARLGLDSGHLARQLRRLEDDGLVRVAPDAGDRRRRTVRLTGRAGPARRLDDRSEQLAERLVAPLTDRQQERLTEALATADLLVRAATVDIRSVHPGPPRPAGGAASTSTSSTSGSRPASTPATGDDEEDMAPGAGAFVVATSDGEPVACGGVQELGQGVGEIKRMWVHPELARRRASGRGCCATSSGWPPTLGHTTVRLDTNGTLVEAIAMYERAGYRHIERYNDNPYAQAWFEKELRPGHLWSEPLQSSSIGSSRASAQASSWSRWCGDRRVARRAHRHHPAAACAVVEVPDVAGDRPR